MLCRFLNVEQRGGKQFSYNLFIFCLFIAVLIFYVIGSNTF